MSCRFFSFPAFLHIWTLSSSDCMILRSILSHWGQLRHSNTTIKRVSNIHWCSRRKYDALRAGGWKLLNRMMSKFSYFVEIYIFFPFSTALRKQQKILSCFRKTNYVQFTLIFKFKKFSPPALNASCFLQEKKVWTFFFLYIYIYIYIYIYMRVNL